MQQNLLPSPSEIMYICFFHVQSVLQTPKIPLQVLASFTVNI